MQWFCGLGIFCAVASLLLRLGIAIGEEAIEDSKEFTCTSIDKVYDVKTDTCTEVSHEHIR